VYAREERDVVGARGSNKDVNFGMTPKQTKENMEIASGTKKLVPFVSF
jgi:aspartate ammonia-lyase